MALGDLKADSVNHPAHYNVGKIEVIEAIEDWKLSFHVGNAVKYLARAGRKDPAKEKEDLEKAIWYIRRQIAVLSGSPPRPNDMPQRREHDEKPETCSLCQLNPSACNHPDDGHYTHSIR